MNSDASDPACQWAARHKCGALPYVHLTPNLWSTPLSTGEIIQVDVGHATVFVACRNAATQDVSVRKSAATPYLWAAASQPQLHASAT